jgi:hypothetical protein
VLQKSAVSYNTRWDRNLSVTADADGLIGHAGAVLLRKLADQCGLTAALGAALAKAGKFPLFDRGVALVSMAAAIVLGATSMSDIAVLAHQEQVFGAPPQPKGIARSDTQRSALPVVSPASGRRRGPERLEGPESACCRPWHWLSARPEPGR